MSKIQLLDLFEEKLETFYHYDNDFNLKKDLIEDFNFENFDKYSCNVQTTKGNLKSTGYVQSYCENNGISGDFKFKLKACIERKVIQPYFVSLVPKDKFIKFNNVHYRILAGNQILGSQDYYTKNGKEDEIIKIEPEHYNCSLKEFKIHLHLWDECNVDYFLRKVKVLQND